MQIRQVEGNTVEGFLKVEGKKGERFLVDFKAASTVGGGLSSLEVDGKKIVVTAGATRRRNQ